jgi:WD40 repeat protein
VVAVGGDGGPIRLRGLPGGEDLGSWGNFSKVWALAYTRDGGTLVALAHTGPGFQNPFFSVWDVPSGREIARHDAGGAGSLGGRLSPEGSIYIQPSPDRKTLRLFDPATAEELLRTDGEAQLRLLPAVSADGRRLTAASRDGILRVWETATGRLLHSLRVGTIASTCGTSLRGASCSSTRDTPQDA